MKKSKSKHSWSRPSRELEQSSCFEVNLGVYDLLSQDHIVSCPSFMEDSNFSAITTLFYQTFLSFDQQKRIKMGTIEKRGRGFVLSG